MKLDGKVKGGTQLFPEIDSILGKKPLLIAEAFSRSLDQTINV